MKFIQPLGAGAVALPNELIGLGHELELIHSSQWTPSENQISRGCWSATLEPIDVVSVILDGATPTVLQSEPEDFANDVEAWVGLREHPQTYFENPLRSLMSKGENFQKITITELKQKDAIRKQVMGYALQAGNDSCQEACLSIFEELFMNAMLDAPRESADPAGRAGASFFLGHDDRRLGIACADPYGSLKIEKLLKRMREVYQKGAGQAINLRGPGGAGLGCTIMMEKSSLVCYGVQPGTSTIVSCLIHRHLSHRRRAELKKSLHLIINE